MRPPRPRGRTSAWLVDVLSSPPVPATQPLELPGPGRDPLGEQLGPGGDALGDDDLQLSLEILYTLHYGGLRWADDAWEWHPDLLRLRAALERRHEEALRCATRALVDQTMASDEGEGDLAASGTSLLLRQVVALDDSPSVTRHVQRRATASQLRELVAQKSLYHLREADFQTWQLPRLAGTAKHALLQIQVDEYGGGRPGRLHQELYAGTMAALGLSSGVHDHLDDVLPEALALSNTLHLFGLHRRHRGRSVGHLAAVEMTSSLPCRRMSRGVQRLGLPEEARRFYDEHVLADALHEQIASVDLAGGLVAAEPDQLRPVLEGAGAYLVTEGRLARALLRRWGVADDATMLDRKRRRRVAARPAPGGRAAGATHELSA